MHLYWQYFRKNMRSLWHPKALVGMAGIVISVTVLLLVLSVLQSYNGQLREILLNFNAHLYVLKYNDELIEESAEADLLSYLPTCEMSSASPFLFESGLLTRQKRSSGVMLKAVHKEREEKMNAIGQYFIEGTFPGPNQVALGKDLAHKLQAKVGDQIRFLSAKTTQVSMTGIHYRKIPLQVAGIFQTGFSTYDENYAYMDLVSAQAAFHNEGKVTGISVMLQNPEKALELSEQLYVDLPYPYRASSWQEHFGNLFAMLQLQKLVLAVIIFVIVCIACFNIISFMSTYMLQKGKEIGILLALGFRRRQVRIIFGMQGFFLALLAIVAAISLSFLLLEVVDYWGWFHLDKNVYFVETVPLQLSWGHALIALVASLTVAFGAAYLPIRKASRQEAAYLLRYE